MITFRAIASRYKRRDGMRAVSIRVTYYAGRHSWATIARKTTEKATVDEALGHVGDYRVTDIYAERDWEQVAEANRRVLALFRWQ